MSAEGEKHAAELAKLEQRRKELEDALQRLARDEAEAHEVADLAQEVEQLEHLVEAARAAANMEKTMTQPTEIRKRAQANMLKVDDQLDQLAKTIQRDGERFEKAYDRALQTEMGQSFLKTRSDAYALATGAPTADDIAEAHGALLKGS